MPQEQQPLLPATSGLVGFSQWRPDSPDLGSDDTKATNVIPWGESYRAMPSLAAFSNALASRCQGAIMARDVSGNVYNYAGDANNLYSLSGASYAQVSKAANAYTVAPDERWEFTQWGNQIIATDFADPVQIVSLGAAGNLFADLAGSPPKARHLAVVRDFLVLGNTYDATDGACPQRVQWSGINNINAWGSDPVTLADFQDLVGNNGGWVQGIVGGEFGTVFQERSIWRMSFVGSPAVWEFNEMEKDRGVLAPGSIVTLGRNTYYLGYDGFYVFNGLYSTPIGVGRVNKYFFADLDQNYLSRVSSAIDPINSIVIWAYPGTGNSGGNPNKLMLYNWAVDKWATVELNVEILLRSAAQGYTLDQLDSIGNLDQLPFSLDSRAWMGGAILLSAFDTSHRLNNFTGPALPATVDTMETEPFAGRRASVLRVRPLVEGGAASIQVGTREDVSQPVTWGPTETPNDIGDCPVHVSGRFVRYRVTTSGGFNHIVGVQPKLKQGGRR